MFYLYIWTFRDHAVSQVPQETIPRDGERIPTTPPALLKWSYSTRYHKLSLSNLDASRVSGSLHPDPAHPLSEGDRRREAGQPPGENFDPSSTARWLCTPTPYASNVTVLGRVLEKCVPTSTSTSTTSGFSQEDIYITIRTTQKNHNTRLPPILLTWLQTVQPDQVRLPSELQ